MKHRKSWDVKGEAIQAELLEIVNLEDSEKALLASLSAKVDEQSKVMAEAFYERLFSHEHTKEYFEGAAMDRLHTMTADWFKELFSGNYDSEYVRKRIEIGEIHVRIGLPVRYPLAMLDVISEHGLLVTATSDQPAEAKAAFLKVLSLDIAIFNQAYENNQLKHLAELVGGERLARLLLSGSTS